jgi:hypothetical protein
LLCDEKGSWPVLALDRESLFLCVERERERERERASLGHGKWWLRLFWGVGMCFWFLNWRRLVCAVEKLSFAVGALSFLFFFFLARGLESKRQGRTDGGKEGGKRQQREREREKSIGMAWGMVGVEEWAGWVMVKHGCGGIW